MRKPSRTAANSSKKKTTTEPRQVDVRKSFHLDFLNPAQKLSFEMYEKHDILFLLGPAGVGKTLLSAGFAIHDLLKHKVEKIVITRPLVEAGESMGYLPGPIGEKTMPYMIPIYDCINKICGKSSRDREIVQTSLEVAPLSFMRGRTMENSIFIFDEAQNATYSQLKLALTRLGTGSKMIITGDPDQSDLPRYKDEPLALEEVLSKISSLTGIGVVRFKENSIVRHSLVSKIVKRL